VDKDAGQNKRTVRDSAGVGGKAQRASTGDKNYEGKKGKFRLTVRCGTEGKEDWSERVWSILRKEKWAGGASKNATKVAAESGGNGGI